MSTTETLGLIHHALKTAKETENPKLEAAAESLLSALVVVLRYENVAIPPEIAHLYELVTCHREDEI